MHSTVSAKKKKRWQLRLNDVDGRHFMNVPTLCSSIRILSNSMQYSYLFPYEVIICISLTTVLLDNLWWLTRLANVTLIYLPSIRNRIKTWLILSISAIQWINSETNSYSCSPDSTDNYNNQRHKQQQQKIRPITTIYRRPKQKQLPFDSLELIIKKYMPEIRPNLRWVLEVDKIPNFCPVS